MEEYKKSRQVKNYQQFCFHESEYNNLEMDFIKVFIFGSVCIGYIGASSSPGKVLDSTIKGIQASISAVVKSDQNLLQKYNAIKKDVENLKFIHGPCAPCRSTPGTKSYCDCRQLEGKQDCLEFYDAGIRVNGLYKLEGPRFSSITAYCDQTTQGGGWTVIMRRKDGSVDFPGQKWDDYKVGFGRLEGEFWFGHDNIHDLTKSSKSPKSSEVLFNMHIRGQTNPIWAKYRLFNLGDEKSEYLLKISGRSGNARYDGMAHNNGRKFSTPVHDNDNNSGNCARSYSSPWWYGSCSNSFLFGAYRFKKRNGEIMWYTSSWQPDFIEIKVRRNKN